MPLPICPRPTCREKDLPARKRARRLRDPVAVTCRVLKLSPPAVLPLAGHSDHRRRTRRAYRADALFDAQRDDPEFSYRYLVEEAATPMAIAPPSGFAHRTAVECVRKKAEQERQAWAAGHDDLVERDFTADALNTLWLSDITEHRTDEGKLYLCAIRTCILTESSATASTPE